MPYQCFGYFNSSICMFGLLPILTHISTSSIQINLVVPKVTNVLALSKFGRPTNELFFFWLSDQILVILEDPTLKNHSILMF